jgi:CheY-like chemotaxis protein
MKKILLHCMANHGTNDPLYGPNGVVHRDLEEKTGQKLTYVGFGGYLHGDHAEAFIKEAADADVILLDAWTHPEGDDWYKTIDPHEASASIARRLQKSSKAKIFAQLMEGVREVAVHKTGALPFNDWRDEVIVQAIGTAGKTRILVVEDDPANIASAKELLGAYDLTIVSGFDQALDALDRQPEVVLTDCMIPKGGYACMGPRGQALVNCQGVMPYGPIIVLHAIQKGVKKIGIITAGNHHDDPFVFAFDGLRGFAKGDVKVVCTNHCSTPSGAKDWNKLLEAVNI